MARSTHTAVTTRPETRSRQFGVVAHQRYAGDDSLCRNTNRPGATWRNSIAATVGRLQLVVATPCGKAEAGRQCVWYQTPSVGESRSEVPMAAQLVRSACVTDPPASD